MMTDAAASTNALRISASRGQLLRAAVRNPPLGFFDPRGHQPKSQYDEDHTCGHPHDQAADLLVLQRCEMKRSSPRLVNRIPDLLREGHQRPQDAGMNRGSEAVHDSNAGREPAMASMNKCPPEQESRAEKH